MRKTEKEIFVTSLKLPPLREYNKYLKIIWKNNWVTNHGELTLKLESELKKYFGVKHLFYVSNGTVALEIAIKALELTGEIITTPFSYVATTSSIVWTNCTPVFADIDNKSFCINPDLIEKAIRPKTSAILATHVYGNPCNIDRIENIAREHRLKVIYDAAHCFGVKFRNKSVLNYGDISTISFHATKLFHTAEGGAVVTNNDKLAHKISYLRNFGHNGQEAFFGLGINGKNSELHAALGLCLLPGIKTSIAKRKKISSWYDKFLNGLSIQKPVINDKTEYNYSYYPVLFESEKQMIKIKRNLNNNRIFPRRYFYPSLNKLNYVAKFNVKMAENISKRILCLPLYSELSKNEVMKIADIIKNNI